MTSSVPSLGGRAQEITWHLYNDPLCPPPQKILLQITGTVIHLVARVIDCVFTFFLIMNYTSTGIYYKISNLISPIQDSKSDQLFERVVAFSDLFSNYLADIPLCLINLISPKIYREQFSIEETTHAFSTCSSPIPGFENPGANCAFNSCLQIFLYDSKWREMYQKIANHYAIQNQSADKDCGKNMLSVLIAYDDACISKKAISNNYSQKFRLALHHLNPQITNDYFKHEDVHEIFTTLFGKYEELFVKNTDSIASINTSAIHFKNTLIQHYEIGEEVTIPKDTPSALTENNTLVKEEIQWQLKMALDPTRSLQFMEILQAFFHKEEINPTFSEDSPKLMKEEKCVQVKLTKEVNLFDQKPNYLIMQFARFIYTEKGPAKIHSPITGIPEQLDAKHLTIKDTPQGVYELTSFIIHLGISLNRGHYISYLKKENRWIKCDDNNTSYVKESDVLQDLSNSYMCFYKLKTD
jgi:ubiquitin C-terminal hydrolase